MTMSKPSPFWYFKTSREIIRLAVMLYVRFPLSLRNVEDLLHVRGIEISHETVRYWWNRFGPMFATEFRGKRVEGCCQRNFACDEAGRSASLPKCPDLVPFGTSRRARRSSAWR